MSWGDWTGAFFAVRRLGEPESKNVLHAQRKFAREAKTLIRAHWPAVVAVAEALLRRHRLSGKQVRRIVRQVEEANG
jgi:hypothetical protein